MDISNNVNSLKQRMNPLQISWLFDFVPGWLGPVIMIAGLPFMIHPYFKGLEKEGEFPIESANMPSQISKSLGYFLISIGFVLISLSTILRYISSIGIILFLMGRWIEGIGASKLGWKLIYYLRYQKFPGGTSIKQRLIYYFLLIFIVFISVGAAFLILAQGSSQSTSALSNDRGLLIIWTLFTFTTSFLGLTYKFWGANPSQHTDHELANNYKPIFFGSILSISGAEIFNLHLFSSKILQITSEMLISSGGLVIYSIGYWIGVVALLSNR